MDNTTFSNFTRRITSKPVVIFDKKQQKEVLAQHVTKALSRVKNKRTAMQRCLKFLDERENTIRSTYPWNSWEITQRDWHQANTLAWVEHLRKCISQIEAILALESIDKMFDKN